MSDNIEIESRNLNLLTKDFNYLITPEMVEFKINGIEFENLKEEMENFISIKNEIGKYFIVKMNFKYFGGDDFLKINVKKNKSKYIIEYNMEMLFMVFNKELLKEYIEDIINFYNNKFSNCYKIDFKNDKMILRNISRLNLIDSIYLMFHILILINSNSINIMIEKFKQGVICKK